MRTRRRSALARGEFGPLQLRSLRGLLFYGFMHAEDDDFIRSALFHIHIDAEDRVDRSGHERIDLAARLRDRRAGDDFSRQRVSGLWKYLSDYALHRRPQIVDTAPDPHPPG